MNQPTTSSSFSGEVLNAQVGEKLTIAKRIGRGRLGAVYAGVHPVLARRFAIKVLRPSLTRDENVRRRLRRMVREASTVEHPNVVSLIDFGELDDGSPFLIMDYVRGTQLTKVLSQGERVPVGRAVPLLVQLADALEAAHRLRVVHGDLKPNNIILVDLPNNQVMLRLHDFSLTMALAGRASEDDPLGHLRIYGSVEFLSPEQIVGGRVDGRADIYAYGAVAYRMLTGEPPFVGDVDEMMAGHRSREPVPPSRRQGAHGVPHDLDAVILRCLEKNPADRFATMDEVSRELQALLHGGAPGHFEEEITGRWQLPPELEEAEEPLPESPARLRSLFHDTLQELGELVLQEGVAGEELRSDLAALKVVREEASTIGARAAVTENRFEDIRRELRERESTLRYAIIDLNLARADVKEHGADGESLRDFDLRIADLEQDLAELEERRADRFSALNAELLRNRDQLEAMEQRMARLYRRIHAHLDEVSARLTGEEERRRYRLLERCRAALVSSSPSS